jgi:hypothetical protein
MKNEIAEYLPGEEVTNTEGQTMYSKNKIDGIDSIKFDWYVSKSKTDDPGLTTRVETLRDNLKRWKPMFAVLNGSQLRSHAITSESKADDLVPPLRDYVWNRWTELSRKTADCETNDIAIELVTAERLTEKLLESVTPL